MKKKLLKLIVAMCVSVLFLQGCGNTGNTVSADDGWKMEYVSGEGGFDIYRDSETGVHYIRYVSVGGYSGLCPRYNADGTLYVD